MDSTLSAVQCISAINKRRLYHFESLDWLIYGSEPRRNPTPPRPGIRSWLRRPTVGLAPIWRRSCLPHTVCGLVQKKAPRVHDINETTGYSTSSVYIYLFSTPLFWSPCRRVLAIHLRTHVFTRSQRHSREAAYALQPNSKTCRKVKDEYTVRYVTT